MGKTIRVTKATFNALTETDQTKFILRADEDNVLIKEKARGTGTVALHNTATIAHNLGYIPFYLVYCQTASGTYRISNSFDPLGSGWRSYVDTTNLYIVNEFSNTYTGYKYFLFYDNMN